MDNLVDAAFNEWMRRFIDEPDSFTREFESIIEFLREECGGKEPSYGASCGAFLRKLMSEIQTNN